MLGAGEQIRVCNSLCGDLYSGSRRHLKGQCTYFGEFALARNQDRCQDDFFGLQKVRDLRAFGYGRFKQ